MNCGEGMPNNSMQRTALRAVDTLHAPRRHPNDLEVPCDWGVPHYGSFPDLPDHHAYHVQDAILRLCRFGLRLHPLFAGRGASLVVGDNLPAAREASSYGNGQSERIQEFEGITGTSGRHRATRSDFVQHILRLRAIPLSDRWEPAMCKLHATRRTAVRVAA
jgi:hypothetical protein